MIAVRDRNLLSTRSQQRGLIANRNFASPTDRAELNQIAGPDVGPYNYMECMTQSVPDLPGDGCPNAFYRHRSSPLKDENTFAPMANPSFETLLSIPDQW